jgi:hypothetical protein
MWGCMLAVDVATEVYTHNMEASDMALISCQRALYCNQPTLLLSTDRLSKCRRTPTRHTGTVQKVSLLNYTYAWAECQHEPQYTKGTSLPPTPSSASVQRHTTWAYEPAAGQSMMVPTIHQLHAFPGIVAIVPILRLSFQQSGQRSGASNQCTPNT